jgi:antitoxin HigA-1
MVRIPAHRAPSHPGTMLLREFLEPLELTQTELAERMEIPFQRLNSLVNGRRSVTPDTALRLSKVFGTTPGFWMNHQLRWDLFHAQQDAAEVLKRIRPLKREDLVSGDALARGTEDMEGEEYVDVLGLADEVPGAGGKR